jgi:hypothetical protein
VSHVVFQHIPDPAVALGYVREMALERTSGEGTQFCFVLARRRASSASRSLSATGT